MRKQKAAERDETLGGWGGEGCEIEVGGQGRHGVKLTT